MEDRMTTTSADVTVDPRRLDEFLSRVVSDLSASLAGVLVSIGHRLGLYKAMAGAGPVSSGWLAASAGCAERYVREWLNAQAAGGYVTYDQDGDTYELPTEQAMVLADEESTVFMPDVWQIPAAMWFDEDKAVDAFRTGTGVAWSEHDGRVHRGVAAFYRNAYRASLVTEWLPALDGVVQRLEQGITVADVGCGFGHSTVLMAEAFPNSRFHGFDAHPDSVREARHNARAAGVDDHVVFETEQASGYADNEYDLICFFDCLHDLGDPTAAARHAAQSLAPGGTVMLIEPFAADRVENNISPISRFYYAASTMLCCAHAISEGGQLVLGAQAGQTKLGDVFRTAGFTSFRRAAQTQFNLVLEARM
jgi:2-polyprenyl-3-methyl-5-hydroxy-6-metoxy-1,4-benzoquinol methylase